MPGEALLGNRLVDPNSLAAPGSVPVPDGLQEVSVQLDAQRVVGGRLAAGDTVGVVVLVGENGQSDTDASASSSSIKCSLPAFSGPQPGTRTPRKQARSRPIHSCRRVHSL